MDNKYFTQVSKEDDDLYVGVVYDPLTSQEVYRTAKNADTTAVIVDVNNFLTSVAVKYSPKTQQVIRNTVNTPIVTQSSPCKTCGG